MSSSSALKRLVLLASAALLGGCNSLLKITLPDVGSGKLGVIVTPPAAPSSGVGLRALGLGSGSRDGVVYVPASYRAEVAAPLVLLLHGAGGSGSTIVTSFQKYADSTGAIILAPDARFGTWDVVLGKYGDDVKFIDGALKDMIRRYRVDAARVAIVGFSDGASYALSLGLSNGDLFQRVLAFSPGMSRVSTYVGKPEVMITHGTQDTVLPIDGTSRRIVQELRGLGYSVDYREFEGPHGIPASLAPTAFAWAVKK